jgi:hypothetical protein
VEQRKRLAAVKVETINIEGKKTRSRITRAKELFLGAILKIIEEFRDYWPLSIRQIHYNLLNDPPLKHASKPGSRYDNTENSYKSADELITRARFFGRIQWEAVDDKTRSIVTWDVHREPSSFIRRDLNDFLKGYYRDLMQSQPNHIEIIGEKNTVENAIRNVAQEY